jgi:hypothetical protein
MDDFAGDLKFLVVDIHTVIDDGNGNVFALGRVPGCFHIHMGVN